MRIAFIYGTPPKKLGSLEQWLIGICEEVRRRGHALDVLTYLPVHQAVQADLARLGAGCVPLEQIKASPVAGRRRLASYDLLDVNLLQPRSTAALLCHAAWPAKVIWVDHSPTVASRPGPLVRRALSRLLDGVTLARAEQVVGVSESVRGRLVRRFHLDPARTRVILNAVDPRRFTAQKAPGASGAMRILCVSQLVPEKGIDTLLRAMALASAPCTLKVVGYGRMEAPLRKLAEELGLSGRVELLGMRDDVHLLVREADVFAHPSLCEACPLAVMEGMASGCGVIASRVGGIPEIVTDGKDGLLVPPEDPVAFACALDRMAFEPGLRERLAAAGRRTVEQRFSLSRCIRDHVDLMEEVLMGKRSAPARTREALAA
ncbi:MAG TPA: glycosyltransferase family 4 protein [Myxococcales bacterium]|nr:glycosyltransferase family 4 protein [Myxococcales bacterium]